MQEVLTGDFQNNMLPSSTSPQEIAELLEKPIQFCEVALKRCDNNREAAIDYILSNEDKPDEFWNEEVAEPQIAVMQFERWGEKLAIVDEESLSEIVAKCVGEGILFTDTSFPPENKSLYFDPIDARRHWKCHDCNRENELPSETALEEYRRSNPGEKELREFFEYIAQTNPLMAQTLRSNPQIAVQLMLQSYNTRATLPPLICRFCKGKFPLGILETKPSQWLRPSGIRDDITAQYGAGAPWKLIRDRVLPEDVRQGAVGNCWFVGALSIMAHQKPHLLGKLFPFNQEFSECGVYLVRLCKDGLWRNVIIDDHFPCNRNKGLSFTAAARRQLWVPLIEKAAAKLFGCYEALHSGTLCEAFSLLTGFSTEREIIKEAADFSDEVRDTLWARLVSAHSEGFLIGLACAAKPSQNVKEIHEKGLQAPHAYVVLSTKELPGNHRLVQLGNPWGDRSPSSWNGAWGNESSEFKSHVLGGLLPAPLNEVNSNGQFWISYSDVLKFFASVEFCRTADSDLVFEDRISGWLPAITGLGDGFEIQTGSWIHGKIRADLSLYQESHSVRESAKGAVSTNVDLGFVLLKNKNAVSVYLRKSLPEISAELFLDQNSQYILVPLSFSNVFLEEHRKVVAAIRTTSKECIKSLKRVHSTASLLRDACNAYCDALPTLEVKECYPGLHYSIAKDPMGAFLRAENHTTCLNFEVNFDSDDSVNISSSRGGLITKDILPPGRSCICLILTAQRGAQRYSLSLSMAAGRIPSSPTGGCNFPPLRDSADSPDILDVHALSFVPPSRLIRLKDLAKLTKDPTGIAMIMNLLIRNNHDVQRLTYEYINAGIAPEEASIIASEEAENIYL